MPDEYTEQEALRMSGWTRFGRRYQHFDFSDKFMDAERKRNRATEERMRGELRTALDAMIDVLGVRDAYPDEEFSDVWVTGPVTTYITHYGRDRFLADLQQLRDAQKSDAAISRLRSAIRDLKAK